MRRRLRMPFLLLALVGLAACATDVPVSTNFDPLERFPDEAGWRWDRDHNRLPDDEALADLELGPTLERVVTEELAARGYREAGSELPAYRLSYQLSLSRQVRPERSFAVGSLSLLLTRARDGHRVWVGFAQTEADVNRSAAEREERLRSIVRDMVANFPPRVEP